MDPIGGNRPAIILPNFDYSALARYYSSGASLGVAANTQIFRAALAGLDPAALNASPPWKQFSLAASEETARRILRQGNFIDPEDPKVQNSGVAQDSEFGNLFALYVGLGKLMDIAEFARDDANGSSMASLLNRRFQSGLNEVKSFVQNVSFETETLLYGIKKSSFSSPVMFPLKSGILGTDYIGAVTSEARGDAIPGLVGNETFTITVESAILGSKVVNIDLSNVSGTLNEDNIVAYLNDELASAGVSTRFKTERFGEFSYGLGIEAGSAKPSHYPMPVMPARQSFWPAIPWPATTAALS